MKCVIDTSAILSGKLISAEHELFTSPRVADEIQPGGRLARNFQYLLEAGLCVREPSESALEDVRKRAEKTGDAGRLSETDIEVLALASELDAVILTDDYSIQNMAEELGLKFQPIAQEGIKEVFLWEYRCTGCGARYEQKHNVCPTCGSKLRSVRKK